MKSFISLLICCIFLIALGAASPNCEDRLRALEPPMPTTIPDASFEDALPTSLYPPEAVLEQGRSIAFHSAYDDPAYLRTAYVPEWHSNDMRWSYMPRRVHTAMHRIFGVYPTASMYYDFIRELGLAKESSAFNVDFANPLESIVLVAMQFTVDDVKMLGNQVVLKGKPSPEGLQVLQFTLAELVPAHPKENILFQLVTDGAVLDQTAMPYARSG